MAEEQEQVSTSTEQVSTEKTETFDRAYVETLRKSEASTRVRLKELEEANEEARRVAAEESGKYKELYESESGEKKTLKDENVTMSEQLALYKERDEKEIESLLPSVPDEFRGLITEDLPLHKRLEMVRTLSKTENKKFAVTPKTPGGLPTGVEKAAMSPKMKSDYITEHGMDAYLSLE
jgi:hypothetical protein